MKSVEVKICGLTDPAQAIECVRCGADAIGLVFYQPSPRNVSRDQAAEIVSAIKGRAATVGVFVDMPLEEIVEIAHVAGLDFVQLHGREDLNYLQQLRQADLRVIKVLKTTGEQLKAQASVFGDECDSLLVEAGKGILPGGNRSVWDWAGAKVLAGRWPMILAGGLDETNVAQAIADSGCDAVDVSSAVEVTGGVKDIEKVKTFIAAVKNCSCEKNSSVFKIQNIE